MPISPDLLSERHPERVGAFKGLYGVRVVSCYNPHEDAVPSERSMTSSSSNVADSIDAIEVWAAQEVQDHLAIHREEATTPCQAIIEPTSAVYNSPDGYGVVWVSLAELDEVNP